MKNRPLNDSPRRRVAVTLVAVLFALGGLTACSRTKSAEAAAEQGRGQARPAPIKRQEPILPIPLGQSFDARKVALGKRLFHDPMLSRDGSVSCASCHSLQQGGSDGRSRSIGIGGETGPINAPTVFNAGLNFRQFWDGRAESLEAQVDGPLQAPAEMGATWDEVIARLKRESSYAAEFKAAYPDGIRRENVRHAIAEFERSLVTPNARFDRFLRGEASALTPEEQAGYAKFKNYGCISCHQGVNVGANMFQRMGAIGDYFADRGNITTADFGRFNVTGNEADRFFFKVPSLRNVAVTPPYFHDGSAPTLEAAVAAMARYQLGRALPDEDLADIVKFLRTLTGEYEGQSL
jgi:cytochrome c peroxidase